MGIVLLLAVQILTALVITVSAPKISKNILGVQLTQEVPPDQSPSDSSAPPSSDQITPDQPPADQPPAATATTEPSPTTTNVPIAPPSEVSPSPTSEQTPPQEPAASPSPAETTPASSPSPEPASESSLQQSKQDTAVSQLTDTQTTAVLNPDELLNSAEGLNKQMVADTQNEENKLSQTTTPSQQNKLLLEFAKDKVDDIEKSLKSDDFSAANFSAQRLTDQVNQVLDNLTKLSPTEASQTKKTLQNLCKNADFSLRSDELGVPEKSEQDLEITRGTCLSVNL